MDDVTRAMFRAATLGAGRQDLELTEATPGLFGGEVDPQRHLYHYTTREAALGSILPQRQFRLGLLAWANDPRESKAWLVSLSSSAPISLPADDEFIALVHQADRLIRRATKIGRFTRDDPVGVSSPPNEVFARGWAHSRMWAHYAGGHSGVCLVFDRGKLGDAMQQLDGSGDLWCGLVEYANRPHVELDAAAISYDEIIRDGLDTVVERHVARYHRGLFFIKNSDWASEWEYRWVLRNAAPTPAFVDISESLVAVVLGDSFPAADREMLTHLGNGFTNGLAIARCTWRNGVPVVLPNTLPQHGP